MNGYNANAKAPNQDPLAPYTLHPEQKRVFRVWMLVAILVSVAVSFLLATTGAQGRPSPPQHDTLMFMQYARALAEGRPYEYQRGDAPATGSTSHLYPALLAVFHVIGFRNENLYFASLLLNAAFYLSGVALTGLLAAAVLPHLMWLAMALSIFSGPILVGVFGQTDMGLFIVCSTGVWVALLYGRPLTAFAALTAAVWTRPEGALVALAVALTGVLFARKSRRATIWFAIGIWGLVQFAAVLGWNRWLTGTLTFHSVLGKGHWIWHPWIGAIKRTAREAAHLLLGIVFCAPTKRYAFRLLYGWPILSGLLAVVGWLRACRADNVLRRAFAWGSAVMCAGAILLTAASGWQGFFYDRHLAWIFPLLAILAAGGANAFYEKRLRSPRTTRAPLLTLLLTGYAVVAFPVFCGDLRMSALTTGRQVQFVQEALPALVPQNQRIGILNYPGLAYVLPHHKLVHLGGYISPRFASPGDFIGAFDVLKHEPQHRFSHWLLSNMELRHPTLPAVLGPSLATETDVFPSDIRLSLLRADWTLLDAAVAARGAKVTQDTGEWELVDRLDVGYDKDEAAHAYEIRDDDPMRRLQPGLARGFLGTTEIADVGRVILGEETFVLHATPGRPATLVWRTGHRLVVNAHYDDQVLPFRTISIGSNASCRIAIEGKVLSDWSLGGETNEFVEVMVNLPADLFTSPEVRVSAAGDHISYGWRLYQPKNP